MRCKKDNEYNLQIFLNEGLFDDHNNWISKLYYLASRIYLRFVEENNLPFFSSAKIKMESYDDTRRLKKKKRKKETRIN